MKNLIIALFVSICFVACSSDERSIEANVLPTTPLLLDKVVTSISTDYEKGYEFDYDENNLLKEWRTYHYDYGYHYVKTYEYNELGQVTFWSNRREQPLGYYTYYEYTYNDDGTLATYTQTSNSTNVILRYYEFSYDGNIVTIEGIYQGSPDLVLTIELTPEGLVKNMSSSNLGIIYGAQEFTAEYDTNGNITMFRIVDAQTGELQIERFMEFDESLNPLFGQLHSIYLERFLAKFLGTGGFIVVPSYDFPYNRNNVIATTGNIGTQSNANIEIDEENYPVNIELLHSGQARNLEFNYNNN